MQGFPRWSHGLPLLSRQDGIIPLAYVSAATEKKRSASLVLNTDDGDVHMTQSLSRDLVVAQECIGSKQLSGVSALKM